MGEDRGWEGEREGARERSEGLDPPSPSPKFIGVPLHMLLVQQLTVDSLLSSRFYGKSFLLVLSNINRFKKVLDWIHIPPLIYPMKECYSLL
jgi:hypothetical protein